MDLTTTGDRSLKGFWQRTEGTWGMVIVALLGVAGLMMLKIVLPSIIGILTMTTAAFGQAIVAAVLASILAAILWVLFLSPFPKLLGYWFKASVRRLTNVFVAVYPIEIMQGFIEKMSDKKQVFMTKKADIRKQQRVVEESIDQVKRELEESLTMMKVAQKKNMQMEVTLAANEAGRAKDDLDKLLQPSLAQLKVLYDRLDRVEQVIDFKIRDMKGQVKSMHRQNEISKSTKGALSAAWSVLRGGDSDQELYDSAVEYVVDDYRQTMGAVDDFMYSTETILNGVDLKKGLWEEKALQMLADLEGKEQRLVSGAPSGAIEIPAVTHVEAVPAQLPAGNYSSKYFN